MDKFTPTPYVLVNTGSTSSFSPAPPMCKWCGSLPMALDDMYCTACRKSVNQYQGKTDNTISNVANKVFMEQLHQPALQPKEVRITDPVTGGQKGQKPERFELLPWDALAEVARVYAYGAEKYEPENWAKGYKWRLSFGALFRHVAAAIRGEDRDPESGLLHLAHAAFHCLTLCAFMLRKSGTDDRAKDKDHV